jgi:lipid-A-disaccharide synthase
MSKIFISAGEASGELYGAQLVGAIGARAPEAECFGLGGPRMEQAGFRRLVRAEDVAHMGITEVVRHMPRIYAEFRRLKASLRRERPDVAILIDFPDVNLRLAEELHRLGIPAIYFVSPQLWAWKKRRIVRVKKYVTRMLVIFPFEVDFYRGHGVAAEFVGHPLAELPLPSITREQFARRYGLDPQKEWIALLPGSRRKQVGLNLPEMLRAAGLLDAEDPARYEFLLPVAPTLDRTVFEPLLDMGGPKIHLVEDARAAMLHARTSIVSSGTATVDAALVGNPFVVVYRLSRLSYAIAKRVVEVPHVAMVNLIAGRRLVPELIQDDFTAANIVQHLRALLAEGREDGAARSAMQMGLREVRASLEAGCASLEAGTATNAVVHNGKRGAIEAVTEIALSYTQSKSSNGRPVSAP